MAIMSHNEQKPFPRSREEVPMRGHRKESWRETQQSEKRLLAASGVVSAVYKLTIGPVVIDTSPPSASTPFQGASCIDH